MRSTVRIFDLVHGVVNTKLNLVTKPERKLSSGLAELLYDAGAPDGLMLTSNVALVYFRWDSH
jgi:hypothetical protein